LCKLRNRGLKTVNEALSNIRKAGKKNWQADAWLVSRLCPHDFADNRHELNQLKKALGDLVKSMAEYENTRTPDAPPAPPAEVPPPDLIPVPTPVPLIPEIKNPTAEPQPVKLLDTNEAKAGE